MATENCLMGSGLCAGELARLKRLAQHKRQVDVAAAAKVAVADVIAFEKGRPVPEHVAHRIAEALRFS